MSEVSLALRNLRGLAILLILAFHCLSAYIVNQPAQPPPFDLAPYAWRAMPIVDRERWLGFDLFCAFQFLYLMQLMFFLSGLFVWPSLQRRGWSKFVGHRLIRLGVPFIIGVYLVMPVAFYPVYRLTAADPDWPAFWSQWNALPITPTGPMWFLWFLIALNIGAALLYRLVPDMSSFLARPLAAAGTRPGRFFAAIVGVTAVAYLPLSAIYSRSGSASARSRCRRLLRRNTRCISSWVSSWERRAANAACSTRKACWCGAGRLGSPAVLRRFSCGSSPRR